MVAMTQVVPSSASGRPPLRPMRNEAPLCPICGRGVMADPGEPADATNTRDFLRRSHATDPLRYHGALAAHPVNQNISRDESSHELLSDFAEAVSDDENSPRSIRQQLDGQIHREWLAQQFK